MKILFVVLIVCALEFLNVSGVYLHKYPLRIIRVRRQQPTPSTDAPVTDAPTTVVPTTVAPTTAAPTTAAPTPPGPTTAAPTPPAPTTAAPTPPAPTTAAPITAAPSTAAPITAVTTPSTIAPIVPTTSAPRKIRFRFRIKFRRNRNPFSVFPMPTLFPNNFPLQNSFLFDRRRPGLFKLEEPKREFRPRHFRHVPQLNLLNIEKNRLEADDKQRDFNQLGSNFNPLLDFFPFE